MTRREFLAASGAALGSPAAQQSRRPNILFLLADDQRWDSLGCMGNPIVRTPNIDSLAAGGVTFENQFVTTSICVCSRASIFTGLHTRCHRIREFRNEFAPALFARSYPALLRAAGYRLGFIGKWGIDGGQMPAASFDYFRGFQGQGHYFPRRDGKTHLTAVMGEQVDEFLDGCSSSQPFCLSVSFKAPHVQDEDPRQFLYDPQDEELYRQVEIPVPKTADPKYVAQLPLSVQRSEGRRRWAVRFSTPELYQTSVKAYYRLITGLDRVVGRTLQRLRALGLDGNTVIIYSADNGFYLAEHGLAGKWLMHEESIRVPLIVYDPRLPEARRGRRVREMTLNLDIAPTLLRLAGLRPPVSMQGRDVSPLLWGESVAWRTDWFYEHDFRANGWIPATEGVRTARWKYTCYMDERPAFEELFDLRADPREEHNLASRPGSAATLKVLRLRREQWLSHLNRWTPEAEWRDPEPLPALH